MSSQPGNPQAAPAVLKAITAVIHDISQLGISKGSRNKEQGYAYRGIDDVLNALSPLYAKHGLVILPSVSERVVTEAKTKSGTALWKVAVRVDYAVMSSADGSAVACSTWGEAMDSADKATNKALSAAYKYLAIQLFAIPVKGQPDADADTPEPHTAVDTPDEAELVTPAQAKALAELASKAGVEAEVVLRTVSNAAKREIASFEGVPAAAYASLEKRLRLSLAKAGKSTHNQEPQQ